MGFDDDIIEVISNDFSVEQVFGDDDILRYVRGRFTIEDVFNVEEYNPQDIFNTNVLEEWAWDNGFIKENENG